MINFVPVQGHGHGICQGQRRGRGRCGGPWIVLVQGHGRGIFKVKVGVGFVAVVDHGSFRFKVTVMAFVKVKVGVRFAADPGSFRFKVRLKVVAIMDLGYRGLQSYLPAVGHSRFSIFRSCIFN